MTRIAADRRVGMLVVANTSPHPLTLEDIRPLELLGNLGGAVLEAASTIEARRAAADRPASGRQRWSAYMLADAALYEGEAAGR